MKTLHGAVVILFAAIFTAPLCLGQAPAAKKSYTFHGKVVAVNQATQRLSVDGEKVDGWMRAMTMNYQVDDPSLFTRLKPGDQIAATVFDGDLVLHYVRLVPTPASGPAPGQAASVHRYRVPQDRLRAFLTAEGSSFCYDTRSNYVVVCQRPAVGNFGQVEVDSDNQPFVNGRPVPPPTYPIPATSPPAGVAAGQQAQADQIWNRAVDLLDRNDGKKAMPLLYQCGLMGDKRCEATLGIRFQDGDVIKADDYKAAYWFGLAVAQGHRAAQYALAGMYQEGEGGLPKDDPKATELLIKSANQGYFKAQYALAFQYEIGDGVPRDRKKAIELFQASGDGIGIADALSDPHAPARFADLIAFARYLSGLRNLEEAASWQQYLNTLPKGGGGCDANCQVHMLKMGEWRANGAERSGMQKPN
ncbi:MAG: copper-binding protein [Bryobacteraceae bacterium]|jgi:Cu/Ag efflux protein CusF